jgi:hypothetical protein
MPQPIVQAQVGNMKFGVTEAQARAFAQQWDNGGIKMILDNTSISFANAWANIALKSALENPDVQMAIFKHVYAKLKTANGQAQAQAQANPAAPAKSSIILTD